MDDSMSAAKTIVKSPKVAVRPMAELCHDALAKGVLALHNGLPPSWLDLLKAHPAAWDQITQEVLATPFKAELTYESGIAITGVEDVGGDMVSEFEITSTIVPASALPKWFFILIKADLELDQRLSHHERDGNGGYMLNVYDKEHIASYWHTVCDRFGANPIADAAMLALFDAFQLDVRVELADELAELAAGASLGSAMALEDDLEILKHWDRRAHDIIYEHVCDGASEMRAGWLKEVVELHKDDNFKASYVKAPHVSLQLDWSNDGLWD